LQWQTYQDFLPQSILLRIETFGYQVYRSPREN